MMDMRLAPLFEWIGAVLAVAPILLVMHYWQVGEYIGVIVGMTIFIWGSYLYFREWIPQIQQLRRVEHKLQQLRKHEDEPDE